MLLRTLTSLALSAAVLGGLLTAPPAALAAPSAAAASGTSPASLDQCLARSAVVPVAIDPEAAPDVARTAAVRTLQHALLSAAPDALAAADLRYDHEGEVVGVDLLEVDTGAGTESARAAIAALPAAAQALVSVADVRVTGQAQHGVRALCDGFDRALQVAQGDGDQIVSVALDQQRGALRIGVDAGDVTAAQPAIARQVRALPTAASGAEPVAAAPSVLAAMGLDDLGVPVEIITDTADEAAGSRLDDRDGHGGGMGILVDGRVACSSGFGVRLDDGSTAIMSSGHCSNPDGTNGQTVTNGFAKGLCGWAGSGARIGTIESNQLVPNLIDSMVVGTDQAQPTMWLGAGCTGSREVAVEGIGVIGGSGSVGFSGTRHGERYAFRTNDPVGCYDFGFDRGLLACAVYRSMSSSPDYVCEPGDSGGPVFQHRGDGTVRAVGLITATGAPLGINRCSYTDVATALWATGASIMTRTPAPAVETTRIAGDNRYETAAEISRAGYPDGAQRVFLASGEVFADALSAGAAAASLRAPLLLTQGARLPDAVRAELRRLDPTTIVVVGGEPSVSAAVAAELRGLAPRVERIGGSDRYETSAMIASYAFPAGATSRAYVATGRNFPDALAAGPVAALQQAPVLLVGGIGDAAPSATLRALHSLGVEQVTVIGGTPSVSEAVAVSVSESLGVRGDVDRIAGVNRYETAVLVNAAFSGTPSRLYLASGERFPDALAASAVAGAQGAPLYLATASCVTPAVQDEQRRLGSPPVVLLGGFPSLRGAVLEWAPCT